MAFCVGRRNFVLLLFALLIGLAMFLRNKATFECSPVALQLAKLHGVALIAALMGSLVAHIEIKVLARNFGCFFITGINRLQATILSVYGTPDKSKCFRHVGDQFRFGCIRRKMAAHQTGKQFVEFRL